MLIAHFFEYLVQIILFIFTIPKVFVLATIFSQKLLSRISFRGFKQFDFLTRGFQIKYLISLINISGIPISECPQKALWISYFFNIPWCFSTLLVFKVNILPIVFHTISPNISIRSRVHLKNFQIWLVSSLNPNFRLLVEPSSYIYLNWI